MESKYIGQTFGMLKVIDKTKGRNNLYLCKCDCGNYIERSITSLLRGQERGHISSCGCRRKLSSQASKEKAQRRRKIGHTCFGSMKKRCVNPNDPDYVSYGAKGIKVCDRWMDKKNGWKNFLQDMGERPSLKHTIDRINNNKDYTPENCRWTTMKEQNNNKDDNVFHKGYSYHNLAEITGFCYGTIQKRFSRGWTIEKVLRKACKIDEDTRINFSLPIFNKTLQELGKDKDKDMKEIQECGEESKKKDA